MDPREDLTPQVNKPPTIEIPNVYTGCFLKVVFENGEHFSLKKKKKVRYLADCCLSHPLKTTDLIEKKPKEYLCGDSALKPPHNASPCFPSTGTPSGEQVQCPCGRPPGINSLTFL